LCLAWPHPCRMLIVKAISLLYPLLS
jgi:hypothetical protein